MATPTEMIKLTRVRPLSEIAGEVIRRWASPNVHAVVPLYAMEGRGMMTRADVDTVNAFLDAAAGWDSAHGARIRRELRQQLDSLS